MSYETYPKSNGRTNGHVFEVCGKINVGLPVHVHNLFWNFNLIGDSLQYE